MMILKVNFTDEEISKFFTDNGFTVATGEAGHWRNDYHNELKWVTYPAAMVQTNNGKQVEAAKLFERVAEMRLKRNILKRNPGTSLIIEKCLKLI